MTINGERIVTDQFLADQKEFVEIWIRQYFKVTVEAIRRYDPNHLVLGLRWAGIPDPLIQGIESEWCDLISLNHYRERVMEVMDGVYRNTGKPILIGEFEPTNDSFRYVRDPIEPPGGYENDDTRCHLKLTECLDRICAHPGIIGYTYYAWKNNSHRSERLKPLIWANLRAASTRVARECEIAEARKAFAPLDGQIVLVLLGRGRGAVSLGLVCRNGDWRPEVYGNGLRGTITDCEDRDTTVRLRMKYDGQPGLFAVGNGSAEEVEVELTRTLENELVGTYTGRSGDGTRKGQAKAFIHRRWHNPLV